MQHIPLLYTELRGSDLKYVRAAAESGIAGPEGEFVGLFEQQMRKITGKKYAIAVTSETAAIQVSLLSSGVQRNDEILVSNMTPIATANAIRMAQCWPCFIDSELAFAQMDPEKLQFFIETNCSAKKGRLINHKTGRYISALVVVHLLGHPADMAAIADIAQQYDLILIENASQAIGAKYNARDVGGLGHIGCFGFSSGNLVDCGGGGMIVTDNSMFADPARYLVDQACDDPIEHRHGMIGYEYRLNNLQSAVGCSQVERMDNTLAAKRNIAAHYSKTFVDVPGLTPIEEPGYAFSNFWLYTMLVDPKEFGMSSRDLYVHLRQERVESAHLWEPMHQSYVYSKGTHTPCEVSEQLFEQAICLPSSTVMTSREQQHVIDSVVLAYNQNH